MSKTFFQAIDDKQTTVVPVRYTDKGKVLGTPLTFEAWLDAAKRRLDELMPDERYAYERLHAFYPKAGPDAVVQEWSSGTDPLAYAELQVRRARPPSDLL